MNGVEPELCERLAPCLEERFFHKFAIEKPLTLSPTQANSIRRQFFLNTVFNRMLAAYPAREGLLLGIIGSDLYKTSHRFVFGDAGGNMTGRATGGDDTFNDSSSATLAGKNNFAGDAGGNMSGFTRGGDDTFIKTGLGGAGTFYGDAAGEQ